MGASLAVNTVFVHECSMKEPEDLLPRELLSRASLRGKEFAWPLDLIPEVIAAGCEASLLSIGGQLQFRFPDGPTCECYHVEVDTYKSAPKIFSWAERVERAAHDALMQYHALRETCDFLAEGEGMF